MKVSVIVAAALLCSVAAGASAQAINDAQIAHIVVTANQVDIDAGKLAASMGDQRRRSRSSASRWSPTTPASTSRRSSW